MAADEHTAAYAVAVVEDVTREGERAEYQANGPDRCLHHKDELRDALTVDGALGVQRQGHVAFTGWLRDQGVVLDSRRRMSSAAAAP